MAPKKPDPGSDFQNPTEEEWFRKDWQFVRRGLWSFFIMNIMIGIGSLVTYYFNSKSEAREVSKRLDDIEESIGDLNEQLEEKISKEQFREFKDEISDDLKEVSGDVKDILKRM